MHLESRPMFSSAPSMSFGRVPHSASAYRNIAAETGVTDASPHRLVAMLYEGFMDAIVEARGAMQKKDVERKGRAIGRAVRIVEEGLRAALNLNAGGRLAQDLNELYRYVGARLTQANLRNDPALLDECQRLIQPLQEAWSQISVPGTRQDA